MEVEFENLIPGMEYRILYRQTGTFYFRFSQYQVIRGVPKIIEGVITREYNEDVIFRVGDDVSFHYINVEKIYTVENSQESTMEVEFDSLVPEMEYRAVYRNMGEYYFRFTSYVGNMITGIVTRETVDATVYYRIGALIAFDKENTLTIYLAEKIFDNGTQLPLIPEYELPPLMPRIWRETEQLHF